MKEFFHVSRNVINLSSGFRRMKRSPLNFASIRNGALVEDSVSCYSNQSKDQFFAMLLLQAKFGLYCDKVQIILASRLPDHIQELPVRDLFLVCRTLRELLKRNFDVSPCVDLVVKELDTMRRTVELAENSSPVDIMRLIRFLRETDMKSVNLASRCCDILCSCLDERSADDMTEIIDWMKQFGYYHSKLTNALSQVILVTPMSDEQFKHIVTGLLHIKGPSRIGPDEEFLQRLLKFRLATVKDID